MQYAHARVASVLQAGRDARRRAPGRIAPRGSFAAGIALRNGAPAPARRFSRSLAVAADEFAPHQLTFYLKDLAQEFHSYYNAERFLVDDPHVRHARLALVVAIGQVLRNGLTILGIRPPMKCNACARPRLCFQCRHCCRRTIASNERTRNSSALAVAHATPEQRVRWHAARCVHRHRRGTRHGGERRLLADEEQSGAAPAVAVARIARAGARCREGREGGRTAAFDFYKILPGRRGAEGAGRPRLRTGAIAPSPNRRRTGATDKAARIPAATRPSRQAGSRRIEVQAGQARRPLLAPGRLVLDGTRRRKPACELALSGWEATVQQGRCPDKSVRYRVRLGPYDNADELGRMKTRARQARLRRGRDPLLMGPATRSACARNSLLRRSEPKQRTSVIVTRRCALMRSSPGRKPHDPIRRAPVGRSLVCCWPPPSSAPVSRVRTSSKARITSRLANPQPVETGKKIEVIEFFSYGCPHCAALEPYLDTWLASCRPMSRSAAFP